MSVSRTSTLAKDVQDAAVAYLEARNELIGVPVIGRRKSNIVSDIAAAVTKAGVCVHVFPALIVAINSNNPGPHVDKLLLRARAIEHPSLNLKGPDAYEVAELLVRLLDGKHFTAVESLQPLYFDTSPVQPVEESGDLVQWDVVAFTSGGLTPRTD